MYWDTFLRMKGDEQTWLGNAEEAEAQESQIFLRHAAAQGQSYE